MRELESHFVISSWRTPDRCSLKMSCVRCPTPRAVQQQQQRTGARAVARAMSTDKQITVPFTKEIDTHNSEFY